MSNTQNQLCPCGTGKTFAQCCQPYLSGLQGAPTPETLMRSRYTAYTLKSVDYLVATTHPQTRAHHPAEDIRQFAQSAQFAKLEVLNASGITEMPEEAGHEAEGHVEFVAYYLIGQKCEQIHENSLFLCKNGVWYYHSGQHLPNLAVKDPSHGGKVGRNDPCPCGSGKKFKKCCG